MRRRQKERGIAVAEAIRPRVSNFLGRLDVGRQLGARNECASLAISVLLSVGATCANACSAHDMAVPTMAATPAAIACFLGVYAGRPRRQKCGGLMLNLRPCSSG